MQPRLVIEQLIIACFVAVAIVAWWQVTRRLRLEKLLAE